MFFFRVAERSITYNMDRLTMNATIHTMLYKPTTTMAATATATTMTPIATATPATAAASAGLLLDYYNYLTSAMPATDSYSFLT